MEQQDDRYGRRLISHYKIQDEALWQLMLLAQQLCPGGEWVFQMFADIEYRPDKREGRKFIAVVTNGDDNVSARADTPGGAVALLIHYLLDGSVFPLTGNGGRKMYPGDNGWVKAPEEVEEKLKGGE